MMDTRQRNAEIVRLHAEGRSIPDLAATHRISKSNVGMILRAARGVADREAQGGTTREAMRSADDIDQQWPLDDLLAALGWHTRVATAVTDYFTRQDRDTASLRDLLDFAVPDLPPGHEPQLPPLWREKGAGKKTFHAMVDALWKAELGEKFATERLRRYVVWHASFPHTTTTGRDRHPLCFYERDCPVRKALQ